MKTKLVLTTLLIICVAAGASLADDRCERQVRGALIGAAVGAIISHNVDGVPAYVAVPASALAGAAIADDWGHRDEWNRHHSYGSGYYSSYRHGWDHRYYGGYSPYYRYPVFYSGYYPYRTYARQEHRHSAAVAPVAAQTREVDRQPGVSIIKVPVRLPSGISVDISILNVNGRFVGPQGEEYDSQPSAETLQQKYGGQ